MPSATALRSQIEAVLADRIPSALTPATRILRDVMPTGIATVDEVLDGGLPIGALTEMIGRECSGRTALALSFVAQATRSERVCAWVDVSNALSPESAAASGVDLKRLLWVRCGVPSVSKASKAQQSSFVLPEKYLVPPIAKKGLHGGGFGPHPRTEVQGLSDGVRGLLRSDVISTRCAEQQRKIRLEREVFEPKLSQQSKRSSIPAATARPWSRIEQALRVTDLILQAGGFSSVVLDMGSIAPEQVSRIPMATWFRYRAAVERTQACVLLLTQHPCAKSSAGLVLRLQAGNAVSEGPTVLTALERYVEVSRQRFTEVTSKVIPLRKPPQRADSTAWHSRTIWAGRR